MTIFCAYRLLDMASGSRELEIQWHRRVWTRDAEASASSDASAFCYCCSENVGILAIIVARLEFSQVQRQILVADMMEAARRSSGGGGGAFLRATRGL